MAAAPKQLWSRLALSARCTLRLTSGIPPRVAKSPPDQLLPQTFLSNLLPTTEVVLNQPPKRTPSIPLRVCRALRSPKVTKADSSLWRELTVLRIPPMGENCLLHIQHPPAASRALGHTAQLPAGHSAQGEPQAARGRTLGHISPNTPSGWEKASGKAWCLPHLDRKAAVLAKSFAELSALCTCTPTDLRRD